MSAETRAMVILRLCKAVLVAGIALFFVIVASDNLTDYNSNFQFVRHVLTMDDTFPGNAEKWRAIPYPFVHHLFYLTIILTESTCALSLSYGAFQLFKNYDAPLPAYQRAKIAATMGIILSLLLWLVAFLVIGGEWFLMWQSRTWSGQDSAFRMFGITALILIFLWQDETSLREGL